MVTFRVPDMTCGHCASTIARAVATVDKGARLEVSVPEKLVSITSPAAEAEFAEAIREAGYTAEKVDAAPAQPAKSPGGCCCGSRRAAPVDAGQAAAGDGNSCCG